MQQPQNHQDAQTQPTIQYPAQQQMSPQVMLCPLQYVYDPQQVLMPSEDHVQPAPPVQQPQPIQHQTYIINVQNPPPWIQNRSNMVYMPQVVNNVPYIHQNMVQNPMINYQYQPMIIQQDLRQIPMTQMQNQSLINQSLIQQQNLIQKQQSLLQNQQNAQATQAAKILQAQQIQNQQRLIQNSQNLVQNQQLMQTAQIIQSPQRINTQSIPPNQPKLITQQSFIINQQDAMMKNAQMAQTSQMPTQVVRQRVQTPQIMQNQRMMLIPQSLAQPALAKQKSTPVLAQILQTKPQPVNQTETMTPAVPTKTINQTELPLITMKPQYHMLGPNGMIDVTNLANFATPNGPNSPNDTTVPQHIRNQIPEGLSVKTILTKTPVMRNNTTNTDLNLKRKAQEKKNETAAKKAKVDNRLNAEAAKARLDADRQKDDKQLRNTVYVQARGRINETGETSRCNASVSTEGIDPNILTVANVFVNTNNFQISTDALHVTENANQENYQMPNVQPTNQQQIVHSESVNASIENAIENVVRHATENENTMVENIPYTQNSTQNLIILPMETQMLPKETQIQPITETQTISNEHKKSPKETKILTNTSKPLPKEPKILFREPKLLPKKSQVLQNEPEKYPKEPEKHPKVPQVLPNEPEILANEPDNDKSLNDMKMALESMNRTMNGESDVNVKKIDKCEKENAVKDKKKLLNDNLKKKHMDGRRVEGRAMREKVERFVLTHVLDGHIIQESNVPFVVQKSSIPLYRKPPKVIQSPIKEDKPVSNSSVTKADEKDSSKNTNKKTENIKNNAKPKESDTGGPSGKKEFRLSTVKTESKKEKESRKLELSKSKDKDKERQSNRIQLRHASERERESKRITEREDRLLTDNDKSKKEKAEDTVKNDKLQDVESTRHEELKAKNKELKAKSKELKIECKDLKAESKELKTGSKELKTDTQDDKTRNERLQAETETELDSDTVNQEDEENPFENVDIATVKCWTATTLYDHLNQHNWHETAQKLHDEEIDGESLLLVNTDQLTQIGISEAHAILLGAFIEKEQDV